MTYGIRPPKPSKRRAEALKRQLETTREQLRETRGNIRFLEAICGDHLDEIKAIRRELQE